jgi:aromatic ring-opening dioxygenase catalytic subunit (LigB family)
MTNLYDYLIVISAHWITDQISISSSSSHQLLFDYGGFPSETYKYKYPAPGSPEIAHSIYNLLSNANIPCVKDHKRGWDHGVFVPLMLMYPEANIPVVAMSLHSSLDPELHIRIGQTLSTLRDQGVLIIGSGYSFHNFDYFFASTKSKRSEGLQHSFNFNNYLVDSLTSDNLSLEERHNRLINWSSAPSGTAAHKLGQEEHLIPLHVIAGAGGSDRCSVVGGQSCTNNLEDQNSSLPPLATSNFEWR